jgi:hypothetical protein
MIFYGASLCYEIPVTAENLVGLINKIRKMNDKRSGRPRLSPAEKMKYCVAVKLCTKDFYDLKAKASAAGMSSTAVARLSIVGGTNELYPPEIVGII